MSDWEEKDNALHKDFTFADFREAMVFINKIADVAEEANHHPDICVSYNRVRISLTTHDEGGITEKDRTLAEKIGAIQ